MDIKQAIKNNRLTVKIIPNSPRNEIKSIENNKVRIAVAAPPEKNKANQELIKFLKKKFKLNVRIKSGATSREKILEII